MNDDKSRRRRYLFEVGLRLKANDRTFTFNGPILYMFPKMGDLVSQNNPLKLFEDMMKKLRKTKVLSLEQYSQMLILFKKEVLKYDSYHKALVNLSTPGSTFRTEMKSTCSPEGWQALRFNWGKPIANVITNLKQRHLVLMTSMCSTFHSMVDESKTHIDLLDTMNDSKLISRMSHAINTYVGKPIPDKCITLKTIFRGTPVETFAAFMDNHIMGKEEMDDLEVISSVFRCIDIEKGFDLDQWMAFWHAKVFLNHGERGLRQMWSDVGPLKTNNTRDELVQHFFPYRTIDSSASASAKRKKHLENQVSKKIK